MNYRYQTNLPIFEKRDQIIQSIRSNQVTIVAGDTGSGKTTQLPLLCLEAGLGQKKMIGCTQPRRIAAISLSEYVGSCFEASDQKMVGYKIRFREKLHPETRIKFMTDGILLSEISQDPLLQSYDAIIIDEAHERTVNIDFLLGYMRILLPKRPDLRLIISSATMDSKLFSRIYHHAPVVTVSGRLFPIEIRYKPVIELWKGQSMDCYIEGAITSVLEILQNEKDGDILIFLPTIEDINETVNRLHHICSEDIKIYPLHSRLSPFSQQQIFTSDNSRKIVVATNIAETSLTVPGVRYVIDSGLARMLSYEPSVGFNRMPIDKISRSSAQQRAGRCGRVTDGICIRLYSEQDFLSRPLYARPEIQRTNLAGEILKMLSLGLGDASRFPFPQQCAPKAFADGYRQLQELGATDKKRRLTRLGWRMSKLPLDPPLSRMLMYACDNGALAEVLIVAAALSVNDPYGYREHHPSGFRHRQSDFMGYISLWIAFHGSLSRKSFSRSALNKFCEKHNLIPLRMREWFDAHKQLEMICRSLVNQKRHRQYCHNTYDIIHKSLLTGLLHGIACKVENGIYHGIQSGQIKPFPSSILFGRDAPWVFFHEIVETSKVYGRMAAIIKPQWIEELFKDQISYSWHDPWFDIETGTVKAREEVVFHGLKLIENRVVDLGRKDRKMAGEVFIREALVGEKAGDSFRFVKHNRKLKEQIFTREQKLRRYLYAGDSFLETLYEEQLDQVVSIRELAHEIKNRGGDSFLIFKESDLVTTEDAAGVWEFPDEIEVCSYKLPVTYRFAPSKDDDGATVSIPESLFKITPSYYWEWLLPVFIKKRIQICIDLISEELTMKSIEKQCAYQILSNKLKVCAGPFLQTLISAVKECFDISISVNSLSVLIPDHLWARIQVLDGKGIAVCGFRKISDVNLSGGDLKGERPAEWSLACKSYEMEFLEQWDKVRLLQQLPVGTANQFIPIAGYPALHQYMGALQVRVFFSSDSALKSQGINIRQMAEQKIAEELAWEIESFRIPENLHYSLCKKLEIKSFSSCAEHIFLEYILRLPSKIPCDQSSFAQYLSDVRTRLPHARTEVINLLEKITDKLTICQDLFKKRINRHGILTTAIIQEELRDSLQEYCKILVCDTTPYVWFEMLPESLNCMAHQIDMGFLEPRKFRQKWEIIEQASIQLRSWIMESIRDTEMINDKHRFLVEQIIIEQFSSPHKLPSAAFLQKLMENGV